jgi:outer membrane protein
MQMCNRIGFNRRIFQSILVLLIASVFVVPVIKAQAPPSDSLALSLSVAIEYSIKNNVQTLLANQQILESEGTRGISLSALLPNIAASSSQASITANLAAMGMPVQDLKGFPIFVGPFNRFDARLSAVQSVFDLSAIRRFQASGKAVELSREQQQLAVQQVTAASIVSYLAVLEGEQSMAAARSNAQLAERLLELATSQRDAGVATGVDVARAETRVAHQKVQLAQAQTVLDSAQLNLLRITGLPLSTNLTLTDRMRFNTESILEPGRAIERALADRIELKMAEKRASIAATQRKAAVAGWLPTVHAFGDYGSSGLTPSETNLPTRSVGIQMNLPIFDGGRIRSEIKVAGSRLQQAEIQRNDLRASIEKEVRLALMNLQTRAEQVKAALQAEALAARELELAQDRFSNGAGDNIEVLNAQTALENARQTHVSSLTQFNIARVNLTVATGHPEDFKF